MFNNINIHRGNTLNTVDSGCITFPSRTALLQYLIQDTCEKYIDTDTYFKIKSMYDQPGRYYHNWNHILDVVDYLYTSNSYRPQIDLLIIAAFLHDAVYDTKSKTNEEDSAQLVDLFSLIDSDKKIVKDIILFTKYKEKNGYELQILFRKADLNIFTKDSVELLKFEKAIFKEYYWVPIDIYVKERIKVLYNLENILCDILNDEYDFGFNFLIDYLQNKKWNIGFFAGSFFPFHTGHKQLLEQAEKCFDKVIIGMGDHKSKTNFEWLPEYGELNSWLNSNYQIITLSQLITNDIEYLETIGTVTLIRGLRNINDFVYEQNYAQTIKSIKDVNIQYYMTSPKLNHISSSMIRELLKIDIKLAQPYLNFN